MNNKTKMEAKVWQGIMDCRAMGMTFKEIAAEQKVSSRYVNGFLNILNAIRKGKYEEAVQTRKTYNIGWDALYWIADRLGVPADALQEKEPEPVKEEPQKAPAVAPAVDYSICFQRMLELQAQTNELLNQLMDVVIPRYTSDMKDNVNANCDVIGQSLKRMEDKMEAIKIGVRRKGM